MQKKLLKSTLAAAFFLAAWMTSNVAKAQVKPAPQQQQKQVITQPKSPGTFTQIGGIFFYDKDKLLSRKDTVVQVGTELKIVVFWTDHPFSFSKVVFTDPIKYEPTPEEIKNGKFSFTVKPERTTTYKYIGYYKNTKEPPMMRARTIKVVDKNGKEIK